MIPNTQNSGLAPIRPGAGTNYPTTSKGQTLIMGDYNTATIAASGNGQAIQITYNFGGFFTFDRFSLMYGVNIDSALVRLVDTEHNRDIISANTAICTIGSPVSPGTFREIPFTIIRPIRISNGNSVNLFLNNISATNLTPKNLFLTLYGIQE